MLSSSFTFVVYSNVLEEVQINAVETDYKMGESEQSYSWRANCIMKSTRWSGPLMLVYFNTHCVVTCLVTLSQQAHSWSRRKHNVENYRIAARVYSGDVRSLQTQSCIGRNKIEGDARYFIVNSLASLQRTCTFGLAITHLHQNTFWACERMLCCLLYRSCQ